jgi:hypothetical protein
VGIDFTPIANLTPLFELLLNPGDQLEAPNPVSAHQLIAANFCDPSRLPSQISVFIPLPSAYRHAHWVNGIAVLHVVSALSGDCRSAGGVMDASGRGTSVSPREARVRIGLQPASNREHGQSFEVPKTLLK